MTSPGTCCVVANSRNWRVVVPDGQMVIADLSSLDVAVPPTDRLMSVYGSTSTNTLAQAIVRAKSLGTRVFDVYDGREFYPSDRLGQLRNWDIPACELYRYANESLKDAEARWNAVFGDLFQLWHGDIGAVIQSYRMLKNGQMTWTEAEVFDIAAAGVRAINRYGGRIKVAPCFAWDRLDGVKSVCSAVCQHNPGVPVLTPIPTPPIPAKPRILSLLFKEFAMPDVSKVPAVVSSSQFTAVSGGVVTRVTNPLPFSYVGLPPAGTKLGPFDADGNPKFTGDDLSLSIQPDGTPEVRPKGTADQFETATKQNGLVVYKAFGGPVRFAFPFAD